VRQIRNRVLRYLRRTGRLTDGDAAPQDDDPSLFDTVRAAAIQGKTALGPNTGRIDPRISQDAQAATDFTRGRLCADIDGFSLHAAVRVGECNRERLERLCRYAVRPPIVHERMSLTTSGRVLYEFKRPWRDGSTHVVLDPLTLLERLAALIPAPRKKLLTHHGVFAPAFLLRDSVVPPPPVDEDAVPAEPPREQREPPHACAHPPTSPSSPPLTPALTAGKQRPKPRPRFPWADLLRRVYLLDVLTCPNCKGGRRLLAFITDPAAISKILAHLGLPTEPPSVAPARPPPAQALPLG
jgi:hypothetical protein